MDKNSWRNIKRQDPFHHNWIFQPKLCQGSTMDENGEGLWVYEILISIFKFSARKGSIEIKEHWRCQDKRTCEGFGWEEWKMAGGACEGKVERECRSAEDMCAQISLSAKIQKYPWS